jgi:hypothetical protein
MVYDPKEPNTSPFPAGATAPDAETTGGHKGFPRVTLTTALDDLARMMHSTEGGDTFTHKKIHEVFGKDYEEFKLRRSTWVHYGLVISVRNIGYKVTDDYKTYRSKVAAGQSVEADKLKFFLKPFLHTQLQEAYNHRPFPDSVALPLVLQGAPYNFKEEPGKEAARVFYKNLNDLKLLEQPENILRIREAQPPRDKSVDFPVPTTGYRNYPFIIPGIGPVYFSIPETADEREAMNIASAVLAELARAKK